MERGPWAGLRPRLDNPMTWSLTLGRIGPVALRAHSILLAWILIEVARAVAGATGGSVVSRGLQLTLIEITALVLFALIHEMVRVAACGMLGGTATEISLWPLGGLVPPRSPHRWSRQALMSLAAPMMGLIVFAILAPTLGALTGHWWNVAWPTPFTYPGWGMLALEDSTQPLWLVVVFSLHRANATILLANLLPLLPLNGGVFLHALLWSRLSYVTAARVAATIGIVTAVILTLVGAVWGPMELVAVAVIGGVTTVATWKRIKWTEAELGSLDEMASVDDLVAADDLDAMPFEPAMIELDEMEEDQDPRPEPVAAGDDLAASPDEVDRILDRIAREGIDSLSDGDRDILARETERQKKRDPDVR